MRPWIMATTFGPVISTPIHMFDSKIPGNSYTPVAFYFSDTARRPLQTLSKEFACIHDQ